jgi:hypothetical protein
MKSHRSPHYSKTLAARRRASAQGIRNAAVLVVFLATSTIGLAWHPAPDGDVVAVAPMDNGQILVAGRFAEIGGVSRQALAVLNPDGTVDPQYNAVFTPADATISAMTLSGDAVFISGTFTEVNGVKQQHIARFTLLSGGGWVLGSNSVTQWGEALPQQANQIIHPDRNGPVYLVWPGGGREVDLESGATLQELPVPQYYDKTILLFRDALYLGGRGGATSGAGVKKLIEGDEGWEKDEDFNSGGSGFDDWVQALAPDAGGEVFVAAGTFTSYNARPAPHLAQIFPDGTYNDRPFPVDAPNGAVFAMVMDKPVADGRDPDWFIAGSFNRIGEQSRNAVARITRSGYGVESFNAHVDVSFFGSPNALAVDAEHLYLGGNFSSSTGTGAWRKNLLRLDKETGALDTTYPRPGAPGTELLADIHAAPGDTVVLSVPENTGGDGFIPPWPRGFPEPEPTQIHWFKDGAPMPPPAEDPWSQTLADVRSEDSGLYTVELENRIGTGTLSFRLQVAEDPDDVELTIYDPDGIENPYPWQGGVLCPVVWGPPTGEALDIDISLDGGATWTTAAAGITDYGHHQMWGTNPYLFASYSIPVPNVETDQAKIRLRRSGSTEPVALSPGTFHIVTTTLPTIEDWRMTHFNTTENTGIAADGFDADHDGQTNLMEYAFGTPPTQPNPPPDLDAEISDGNFEITVPLIRNDLILVVEQSQDLATWTPVASSQSPPFDSLWKVRVPMDTNAKFLHVKVSRPFP